MVCRLYAAHVLIGRPFRSLLCVLCFGSAPHHPSHVVLNGTARGYVIVSRTRHYAEPAFQKRPRAGTGLRRAREWPFPTGFLLAHCKRQGDIHRFRLLILDKCLARNLPSPNPKPKTGLDKEQCGGLLATGRFLKRSRIFLSVDNQGPSKC